jgi:hypothetical protein
MVSTLDFGDPDPTTAWDRLAPFESTDIVMRFYKAQHRRSLNREQAKNISARIRQARELFTVARTTPDIIRPIVVYYGTLALARSFLMCFETSSNESTMKASHGLTATSWNPVFRENYRSALEVKIKIEVSGTFASLMQRTRNGERVAILKYPSQYGPLPESGPDVPQPWRWHTIGTDALTEPVTVTLHDVIARLPDLQEFYRATTKMIENEACRPATAIMNRDQEWITVVAHRAFRATGESSGSFRELYGIDPLIEIDPVQRGMSFVVPGPIPDLPYMKSSLSGNTYLVSPINGNLQLSTLSMLYIIAFAASVFARYYPVQWATILGGGVAGDEFFPLIKRAVEVAEAQIPARIAELLSTTMDLQSWGE